MRDDVIRHPFCILLKIKQTARYTTHAKGRWLERSILEVFAKEFQDQSKEYYEKAIIEGTITLNGKKVTPAYGLILV